MLHVRFANFVRNLSNTPPVHGKFCPERTEFGTPGRKEGGTCTGGGKKRGKKKLRIVAGTEIKGCGWREVCSPHPPPCPSPSPSPIQAEMAEMLNPVIKVSRNGQFAVK